MAPLCVDPRQIVITFNRARRQAILKLAEDIIQHMIQDLDTAPSDLGLVGLESYVENKESGQSKGSHSHSTDGPSSQAGQLNPVPRQPTAQGGRRPTTKAERIQRAAVKHIKEWRNEFLPRLEEIVNVEDDDKIKAERQKRNDSIQKNGPATPDQGGSLIDLGEDVDPAEDFFSLQMLYKPFNTRLTTVPTQDRKEALSCLLLLLLSTGKYSAYSRTFSLYFASSLELSQSFLVKEEIEIAKSLIDSSKSEESRKAAMSAEAETAKRQEQNKFSRYWKVGLASVAGAAIIGVTGGLAAPLVAGAVGGILGGVGLGGVASFLGIFWMNGALVGALFGAYGAKMTGEMMDKYAKEVEDFKFIPLNEELDQPSGAGEKPVEGDSRRLRVTIGINGWLRSEADVTKPWRVLSNETEVFALRYEMKTLLELGTAFEELAKSAAWNVLKSELIKRTILATLWAALWPLQLIKVASFVDNQFSRATNRSTMAGQLLADALINRVQGERPVTLVGYSNGATAIHACLQSLAERHAFGLIDTVVLIGAPAPAESAHWRTISSTVSGKIFNVYSENDMMLGFVHRMTTLTVGIAGLQAVKDVKRVENLDLSESVSGHLRYPALTGEILRKCGFIGIHAGKEIEEDEDMKMKHEAAARGENGEEDALITLETDKPEAEKSTPAIARKPVPSHEEEASQGPPLPSRPSRVNTKSAPVDEQPAWYATLPKREAEAPDSPDSDTFQHITMVDGSDDEDEEDYEKFDHPARHK